ncbi:MAG: hypothetical protein P4L40_14600 [Terracidiphilus sp.]|nr:hypothetical protein [Terracidiphilus sp.]
MAIHRLIALMCVCVCMCVRVTPSFDCVCLFCVVQKLKVPDCYPLQRIRIVCEQLMGVTEAQWRRWELQMIALLSQRVGGASALRSCCWCWRCA